MKISGTFFQDQASKLVSDILGLEIGKATTITVKLDPNPKLIKYTVTLEVEEVFDDLLTASFIDGSLHRDGWKLEDTIITR